MNILVASYSSIVIELLKLVFKDIDVNVEYTKSLDGASLKYYDVIFIDDSISTLKETIENIKKTFKYSKLILLGDIDSKEEVDIIINKPFLPQDIKETLKEIKKELKSFIATNVLDPQEIEKIKELMSSEDIIENTQDTVTLLSQREGVKLKGKDAKEFLYECRGLTKKELKRLLKGSKISIKISFKKSS